MKGDFSRDSFEASKHFLRVLMQQGRVQLDADWNEQVAILLHYMQTLAKDLIGEHAGPGESFLVLGTSTETLNFNIGFGHYYVNGILCENNASELSYAHQPNYPLPNEAKLQNGKTYLVYLDVWERHLSAVEAPAMREVALGGPDTATRTQALYQIKTKEVATGADCLGIKRVWQNYKNEWQPPHRGLLKAQAQEANKREAEPCVISPESQYRGLENQLYRVEIHKGGAKDVATFKWSRDNGTVIFPITKLTAGGGNTVVTVKHLGRDDRYGLRKGDWVEIVDDDYTLQGRAETLLQVLNIDPITLEVTLAGTRASTVGEIEAKHPFLRRWDQRQQGANKAGQGFIDGVCLLKEDTWLALEDGVQINFKSATNPSHSYRTGDYWLIPTRTATGDVIWPQIEISGQLEPRPQPPHGVEHHYAPLGIVSVELAGEVAVADDCRCTIAPLAVCPGEQSLAPQPLAIRPAEIVTPESKPKTRTRTQSKADE